MMKKTLIYVAVMACIVILLVVLKGIPSNRNENADVDFEPAEQSIEAEQSVAPAGVVPEEAPPNGIVDNELVDAEARQRPSVPEPPPALPIALPPEFAYIEDNPNSFHAQIQREPVDPVWSPATEGQLVDYFSERPEITQKYGSPIINCRTTLCEIAFVTYGIDNSLRASEELPASAISFADFQRDNAEFLEQPWIVEFGYTPGIDLSIPFVSVNSTEEGATTVTWYLIKGGESAAAADAGR